MNRHAFVRSLVLTVVTSLVPALGFTAEITPLGSVKDPGENRRDEPVAKEYSLEKATTFLDAACLTWQKERQCFTCHTNYAHLYARPADSENDAAAKEVRRFAEELIEKRWVEHGPRWDAEVIATGAALAFNDAATTKTLHPLTRTALDRMWTVQREDGGFTWIKCNWPPMEHDDHYGVTLAALAVGIAPDDYAKSEQAAKGIAKLKAYFKANPGSTLHHRAMVLWASSALPDLLTDEEKTSIINELSSLQKVDGGWGLATLGDWKRKDADEPQDLETSDGYGTGFVTYVLMRNGVKPDDPRIQRGLQWLKSNQRESGRWFTRSLYRDSKHYITHAGTAFAIMALREADRR